MTQAPARDISATTLFSLVARIVEPFETPPAWHGVPLCDLPFEERDRAVTLTAQEIRVAKALKELATALDLRDKARDAVRVAESGKQWAAS